MCLAPWLWQRNKVSWLFVLRVQLTFRGKNTSHGEHLMTLFSDLFLSPSPGPSDSTPHRPSAPVESESQDIICLGEYPRESSPDVVFLREVKPDPQALAGLLVGKEEPASSAQQGGPAPELDEASSLGAQARSPGTPPPVLQAISPRRKTRGRKAQNAAGMPPALAPGTSSRTISPGNDGAHRPLSRPTVGATVSPNSGPYLVLDVERRRPDYPFRVRQHGKSLTTVG